MDKENNSQKKLVPQKFNHFIQYSGIAFQFFGLIFAGLFIGSKLDEYIELNTPVFTISFLFLFVIGFFIRLYIDLFKKRP
jgi:F0F1-type ATP synthase assembly protein I